MHISEKIQKIKRIIILITVILLIFNLNHIIYFFFDDNVKLHKIEWEHYNVNKPAYTYLNELEYPSNNLQEMLTCTGWAFAETPGPDDNSSTYLIFKGEKNTYITEKLTNILSSVQTDVSGWKNIHGECHNFAVNVSTLILPSDIYEIYVYIENNGQAIGLVNAGRSFRKKGIYLYSYALGFKINDINPETIKNTFDDGWTTLENVNDCIEVSGWNIINGINSEESTYYLVFVGNNKNNTTIQIPTIYLLNVGESLGNWDYIASGFRGALSYDNLPDTVGNVYVIAENNGMLYKTEAHTYDIEMMQN